MKATGIVRRIDDLGRVVIPKEIRRTMRIREGDPLEIYTDRNGEVIFKKYSPLGDLHLFVQQLCEAVSKTLGMTCVICDCDSVIAAAGSMKKEVYERSISSGIEHLIEKRQTVRSPQPELFLTAENRHTVSIAVPIISGGDVCGCIALLADDRHPAAGDTEHKLLQTISAFIDQQMVM